MLCSNLALLRTAPHFLIEEINPSPFPIWHTHEATGNFRRGCPLEIHVRRTYRGEASASHAVSPLARRLNESDVGAEKGDEDARESDRVSVAGEECFHVGFSVRAP